MRAPSSAPLATTRLRQSTHRASRLQLLLQPTWKESTGHCARTGSPLGSGKDAVRGMAYGGGARCGKAQPRSSTVPRSNQWSSPSMSAGRSPAAGMRGIAADRGAARSEPRSNQFCVLLLRQHHGLSDGLSVTWPFHARSTECTLRVLVRTAAHGRFHVVPVRAPAAELLRPRGRVRPRSELVQQHPVGVAATETETQQ